MEPDVSYTLFSSRNKLGPCDSILAREHGTGYRSNKNVPSALVLHHDLNWHEGMEGTTKKPGNYLSIDGGLTAAWGLCALYILNDMFERLQWDLKSETMPLPCEVFEIIIGTGFGGLIALLLGRLRLSPSQAIGAYEKLIPALSVATAIDDEERKRNTEIFEAAFSAVLVDAKFSVDAPMIDKDASKTVVCTLRTTNAATPFLLRSYRPRGNPPPDCTILQAACASVASLDRFLPVTLGTSYHQIYLTDAVLGYANPTQLLLREAQIVVGKEAKVATVVSIGLGKVKVSITRDPSDLKQAATNCEQVHRELEGRLKETGVYSRFNPDREPNSEESALSSTSTYLDDEEISDRLNEATKSIQHRLETTSLKDINSATTVGIALKPRPSLVRNFVGREDILEAMRQTHLDSRSPDPGLPAVSVLMGLGGSGKTQIALKFALEYEGRDPEASVYFFDARSEDKLKADFELAVRARDSASRSKSYEDAFVWFSKRKDHWLIIMDNADNPSVELFSFIPKSSCGNVIITTRNSTYKTLAPNSSHHVEGLTSSDAIELILKGASYGDNEENQSHAKSISDALGHFPLALAHAAGYISIHRCLPTYLEMFLGSRAQFLASKSSLPQDYDATVATTIELSFNSIPPGARNLMILLSRFDASSIAQNIIVKSAERLFRHIDNLGKDEVLDPQTIEQADALMAIFCPSGRWLESDFNDIVKQCLQYSLLQVIVQVQTRFYSMHILVQAYLQSKSNSILQHQVERLVARLLGSAVTVDNNHKYHTFNRLLSPHLKLVATDHVVEAGDHCNLGQVLHEQGNAQRSIEHLERCLELRKSSLGDESLETVHTMASLAISYHDQGRDREALELEVKVLNLRKRLLGDEHPDTVFTMGDLAVCYSELGRSQEAMELEEKVLNLRRRLLGDEHPDTMRVMSNLSVSYGDLGRYKEALELGVEVLDLRKRFLGDEHPATVRAMSNLASSYHDMGRHRKALELKVEVLDMQKRLLGDEHPDTLSAIGYLAASYSGLGRHREALELKVEVLNLRKGLLGDEHPETVSAMGTLASSYSDMGRHKEALELKMEVLDLRKRILGDEHPDTVLATGNIASSYSDLGRHKEALELKLQVLDLRKRISGDEHPATVLAMGNLASSYSDLGKYREAFEFRVEVLDLQKQLLGDDHPETVLAMGNLALSYRDLRRNKEALELKLEVLDLRKRISGDEHPETVLAMGNLASSYSDLGRHREALELKLEVLDLRKRLLGDDHPSTLRAMANLACSYGDLGRLKEAEDLEEKVLEMRTQLLGKEHPDTLLSMWNLSFTLHELEKKERAIALLQAVVPLQEKALGMDHPDTISMKRELKVYLDASQ